VITVTGHGSRLIKTALWQCPDPAGYSMVVTLYVGLTVDKAK